MVSSEVPNSIANSLASTRPSLRIRSRIAVCRFAAMRSGFIMGLLQATSCNNAQDRAILFVGGITACGAEAQAGTGRSAIKRTHSVVFDRQCYRSLFVTRRSAGEDAGQ